MSEDEGKAGKAQKKTAKSQKGRAWLKEGEDDEPLNFLDPKVSQRVLGKNLLLRPTKLKIVLHSLAVFVKTVFCTLSATDPALKKSSKVKHGFKVTSDGRLIIRDDDDDEEDVKDKGK